MMLNMKNTKPYCLTIISTCLVYEQKTASSEKPAVNFYIFWKRMLLATILVIAFSLFILLVFCFLSLFAYLLFLKFALILFSTFIPHRPPPHLKFTFKYELYKYNTISSKRQTNISNWSIKKAPINSKINRCSLPFCPSAFFSCTSIVESLIYSWW